MMAPAAWVGLPVLGWAMLIGTVAMARRAWRWTDQLPAEYTTAARTGMVSAAAVFSAVLALWTVPHPESLRILAEWMKP